MKKEDYKSEMIANILVDFYGEWAIFHEMHYTDKVNYIKALDALEKRGYKLVTTTNEHLYLRKVSK